MDMITAVFRYVISGVYLKIRRLKRKSHRKVSNFGPIFLSDYSSSYSNETCDVPTFLGIENYTSTTEVNENSTTSSMIQTTVSSLSNSSSTALTTNSTSSNSNSSSSSSATTYNSTMAYESPIYGKGGLKRQSNGRRGPFFTRNSRSSRMLLLDFLMSGRGKGL